MLAVMGDRAFYLSRLPGEGGHRNVAKAAYAEDRYGELWLPGPEEMMQRSRRFPLRL